jgi:glycosyltransferase involved in cell wall biosynthesis
MRICYFGNAGSIHMQRWVGYFAELGHEVHLISMQLPTERNLHVHYHQIPSLSPAHLTSGRWPVLRAAEYFWRARRLARALIQSLRPEIVHGHYVADYGHLAWLGGHHPLALTAWGSDVNLHARRAWSSRWLTSRALAAADLITANSTALKASLTSLGVPAAKVQLIQFGVNTEQFASSLDTGALRQELGFGQDEQVIFSPRALQPVYNIDAIVRAFGLVAGEFPKARLILRSHAAVKAYQETVEALIQTLGLTGRVHFLAYLPYEQMARYYNLAEVVVSMASSEGMPASVQEALSCGSLVVASDIPALRELITSGETGYLAKPQSAEDIAAQLRCALRLAPETRRAWGLHNRELILASADQRANMARMEALYDALLSARKNAV